MPRAPFERELAKWLLKTKDCVPESAFKSYLEYAKTEFPDAFASNEPGRPKATKQPEKILNFSGLNPKDIRKDFPEIDEWDCINDLRLMKEMNDYSLLSLLLSCGNSVKECAKLSVCLGELGVFPLKKIKEYNQKEKIVFAVHILSIYNLFKVYTGITFDKSYFYTCIKDILENPDNPQFYSKEEKERDKNILSNLIAIISGRLEDIKEDKENGIIDLAKELFG